MILKELFYQPFGIYFAAEDITIDAICAAADAHNFKCFVIDGEQVTNKQAFLQQVELAMNLPYFGHNWDALWDILTSTGWHPDRPISYIFLFDNFQHFATHDAVGFSMFVDIIKTMPYGRAPYTSYFIFRGDRAALQPYSFEKPATLE